MFRLTKTLIPKYSFKKITTIKHRCVQVSVIGAANPVGSNVSLFLMQNPKITRLRLYDDDEKVKGFALELASISRGTRIQAFSGQYSLAPAVRNSNLILMLSRTPKKVGHTKRQILSANAPAVRTLCRTIADENKEAFFAIFTDPLNCIVPFASSLMSEYGAFNPVKLCGITHIDSARSRQLVASVLNVSPNYVQVPVIGGHSEETIVPLFSNITPSSFSLSPEKFDTLTRLVRKADIEVANYKNWEEFSVLCAAWSVAEFAENMVTALSGYESIVHCFSSNPYYGTRFFAGPTLVGPRGIIRVCSNMPMNVVESNILNRSIPILNNDVCLGENYRRIMTSKRLL